MSSSMATQEDEKLIMQESTGSVFDIAYPLRSLPKDIVDFKYVYYESLGSNLGVTGNNTTFYRLYSTDGESFYYLPSAMLEIEFFSYSDNSSSRTPVVENTVTSKALASNPWLLFQDAKLLFNDELVSQVLNPGKLVHMILLTEKDKGYIKSVGANSGYYIDEVSDRATLNAGTAGDYITAFWDATGVTDSAGSATVTLPVATTTGTAGVIDTYAPKGMYNEIQISRKLFGGVTGIQAVRKNPNFDQAFKDKIDAAVAVSGTVSRRIFLPLKDLFPIMSMDRVIRGTKIEIQMNKQTNATNYMFGSETTVASSKATATAGFIDITKMRLWVAKLKPSVAAYAKVEKQIAANPSVEHEYENYQIYSQLYPLPITGDGTFTVSHKQNKPKRIYVAFQYSLRDQSVLLNPLQFDLLCQIPMDNAAVLPTHGAVPYNASASVGTGLNRVTIEVNGTQVPVQYYNPSSNTDIARIVNDLYEVAGVDDERVAPITQKNWVTQYPIFGFDTSMVEGSPYESRTQTVIEVKWNDSLGATNTGLGTGASLAYNVWCLVVSEGRAKINSASGRSYITLQ